MKNYCCSIENEWEGAQNTQVKRNSPEARNRFMYSRHIKAYATWKRRGLATKDVDTKCQGSFIKVSSLKHCHRWFSQTHWYFKELKVGTQTVICTAVFIAALFTKAGTWKKSKYPVDDWIDKQNVEYIHSGLFSSLKEVRNSNISYIMELCEVK